MPQAVMICTGDVNIEIDGVLFVIMLLVWIIRTKK